MRLLYSFPAPSGFRKDTDTHHGQKAKQLSTHSVCMSCRFLHKYTHSVPPLLTLGRARLQAQPRSRRTFPSDKQIGFPRLLTLLSQPLSSCICRLPRQDCWTHTEVTQSGEREREKEKEKELMRACVCVPTQDSKTV